MKKIMKPFVLALGAVAVTAMTGCTQIPVASQEEKMQALKMEAVTDKAVLYTLRGSEDGQKIHILPIEINGQEKNIYGMSFSKFVLEPGVTKVETDVPELIGSDAETQFSAEAGKSYFLEFRKHWRPLIGPKAEIIKLDEPTAKNMMNKLNYITANEP